MKELENGWLDSIPFPKNGIEKKDVLKYIRKRMREVPSWETTSRLGFAMTKPSDISMEVIQDYIELNPNNIGVHTKFGHGSSGTRKLEKETIGMLADLYNGRALDGYLTSGGTEGNLCGLRTGRNTLRRLGKKKILVIMSELTHHSIEKASEILDLPYIKLSIASQYNLDLNKLKETINIKYNEGFDGFIVISTAGYYSAGSVDNIEGISQLIENIQSVNPQIGIYYHLDAAYGGFVLPFSNPDLSFDFRNTKLHSITIDPHKIGLMPYGCGAFLCRKGLIENNLVNAEKSGVIDETIIGSRPGVYAAALYANLANLGRSGYEHIIKSCIERADNLIDSLKKIDSKSIILKRSDMNIFAISFNRIKRLSTELEEKYRLVPNKMPIFDSNGKVLDYRLFYHIYIMPSVTNTQIDKFLNEITIYIENFYSHESRDLTNNLVSEEVKQIRKSTPCPRHSLVHPIGKRNPEKYPDHYSFHKFLSRGLTGEVFKSEKLYYSDSLKENIYLYAPCLEKPFQNEFGGIAVKNKFNFEILDQYQSQLSLIGDSHFFLHSPNRNSEVLLNFYKNGSFRSVELKLGSVHFTDEVQLFDNEIIFKIGKDARAFYRSDDNYSFSIDTSAEFRIKLNDKIQFPILKDVQYNSDPLLKTRKHLDVNDLKRFPNRYFGTIIEIEIPRISTGTWRLKDILKQHGWKSDLSVNSAKLGLASINITLEDNLISLNLKAYLNNKKIRMSVPINLLEKLQTLPKLNVGDKKSLKPLTVAEYSENLYELIKDISNHISEDSIILDEFSVKV
ncbi:pyridoxal-dependent decarboxylase [Bacillus cereus group sp. MYBK57-1]|uniref:pyridoxal-dependent decarboxylase n=1 Tax=Bacillus cereus group sp. MYBK57-1 TaxID=3450619 RepID=UPI003F79902F